jgi:hypothetical protein
MTEIAYFIIYFDFTSYSVFKIMIDLSIRWPLIIFSLASAIYYCSFFWAPVARASRRNARPAFYALSGSLYCQYP